MERSGVLICSGIWWVWLIVSEDCELKSGKSHPNRHCRYESPSNTPGTSSRNTRDREPLWVGERTLTWEALSLRGAQGWGLSSGPAARTWGGGLASPSPGIFHVNEMLQYCAGCFPSVLVPCPFSAIVCPALCPKGWLLQEAASMSPCPQLFCWLGPVKGPAGDGGGHQESEMRSSPLFWLLWLHPFPASAVSSPASLGLVVLRLPIPAMAISENLNVLVSFL